MLEGKVDGGEASILMDSGASITIVPEGMVKSDRLTGETVSVRAFQSKVPMLLPTAMARFEINELSWEELVALAPVEKGREREVLYGLDLKSESGLDLVLMANRLEQGRVRRVTTRAEARQESLQEKEDASLVAKEQPVVQSVTAQVGAREESPGEGAPAADRPAGNPEPVVSDEVMMSSEESLGEGDPVADRPAGDPEPSAMDVAIGEESVESDSLAEEEQEDESRFSLRAGKRGEVDLDIPPVKLGDNSRSELVREVRSDPSLAEWRGLADKEEQGFCWQNDLLFQATTTHTLEIAHLMVLPTRFRCRVLDLAHERSGHLGARKVKALIKQRFVWPGMGQDVIAHCRSCSVCQLCSKRKAGKVPLVEREVLSEPFENIAFDIVGPLPKGKGGCRFVLTAICMASKWPEAIPLRTITARAMALGMVEIFSRTGIPLQLLTDQGSQFVGSLVSHLCRDLHIDKIRTTPYHPECNGVIERMHGTLGSMLTKASALGLDWVGQLPFALFALRSAPNKDTLFSPFQLVYGHRVRTPLDILHQGWAEVAFTELDTNEWSDWLVDRLEVWHDVLRERGGSASAKRKETFDKHAVTRTLEEGDQVLCRVPGMSHKLQEAWHGPYNVIERKNRVDYKVDLGKGRRKVLHINNLKKYHPREEEVMRIAVVAEDWQVDRDVGTRTSGVCLDFDRKELERMKLQYPEVFSDLPGETSVARLKIDTTP